MATKTIAWNSGTGSATLTYNGQGDGAITVVSDENNLNVRRSMNITIKTTDNTVSRSVTVIQEASDQGMYVDLGLPSGTLWAKGNIVSDGNGGYKVGQETDYGAYFSWGNSVPHFSASGTTFDDGYDFGTSSTGSPYKDTPGATIQYTTSHKDADFSPSSINDAARQLLGGKWRVPTANEIQELVDNTDFQFTTINGVKGGKFMKKSDNSIYVFLPGTGFYDTSSHQMSWRVGLGDYWSSSLNGDDAVFYLYFQTPSTRQLSDTGQRFMARGIRPVRDGGGVPPQPSQDVFDFDYTGAVQSKTLSAGTYKLECWGAQGGSIDGADGGKGGYAVGTLQLTSQTTVYIYVGGQGAYASGTGAKAGGFNGGGNSYGTTTNYYGGSGGGGSDIRLGANSLSSRVIVAGGGGGAGRYNSSNKLQGGYGGGATGGTGGQAETGAKPGGGGTQSRGGYSYNGTTLNDTTAGTLAGLGVGGGAKSGVTSYRIVGGGGGYYGGGYGMRSGAGGGSGYVGNLSDAQNKAGNTSFPSTSGGTETGHSGNGYVRITKTA